MGRHPIYCVCSLSGSSETIFSLCCSLVTITTWTCQGEVLRSKICSTGSFFTSLAMNTLSSLQCFLLLTYSFLWDYQKSRWRNTLVSVYIYNEAFSPNFMQILLCIPIKSYPVMTLVHKSGNTDGFIFYYFYLPTSTFTRQ